MRSTRPQFTIRRLMVAVAIVAMTLWLYPCLTDGSVMVLLVWGVFISISISLTKLIVWSATPKHLPPNFPNPIVPDPPAFPHSSVTHTQAGTERTRPIRNG